MTTYTPPAIPASDNLPNISTGMVADLNAAYDSMRTMSAALVDHDDRLDPGALDAGTAGFVEDTGSATRAAVDAAISAGGSAPTSLTGTYAARPAATAVAAGTVYYATDVPEQYRSNAAVWSVVGSGGNELGYAQITAMFTTTSTTPVYATGLTVTFIVGERPVEIHMEAALTNSIAAGETKASLVLDGTVVGWMQGVPGTASAWRQHSRSVRRAGLTPGSTHTVQVQLASTSGGGTAYLSGDLTSPSSLSVVTR